MRNCYIAHGSKLAARVLGTEVLIMSAPDSTIFSLNEVGSLIWEGADGKTPLRRIVEEKVLSVFEIDSATALADAEAFVTELAAAGVLRVSESPMNSEDAA
jgi:hypothetical protein